METVSETEAAMRKMKTKEYQKRYYVANKEKILKRSADYIKNHPVSFKAYVHRYYQKNKEVLREKARQKYAKNRDVLCAKAREKYRRMRKNIESSNSTSPSRSSEGSCDAGQKETEAYRSIGIQEALKRFSDRAPLSV